MKEPDIINNSLPSDDESWGSYNKETKQWSERVFSGKVIREWIQKKIKRIFSLESKTTGPNQYLTNVAKTLTIKNGLNEEIYHIDIYVPEIRNYNQFKYFLSNDNTLTNIEWKILNGTSSTYNIKLGSLNGVSNWYDQNNQYIYIPKKEGIYTSVSGYINFTDSLGGSLLDQFEIQEKDSNIILTWKGVSALSSSDSGSSITFKTYTTP